MAPEKKALKIARALEVAKRMDEHYPAAQPALTFSDPFTLTIAVLLSAQTTDAAVNKVTPLLFEKYGTPEKMASAPLEDVENIIKTIGFYRNKAKNCIACAQKILTDFEGEVPSTMEELVSLPGVGRKTANIVLNEGFGVVEGIAVDTHVFRIAHKLKFSFADNPLKTEQDLLKLYPQQYWKSINSQWILFGREYCIARKPRCKECFLSDLCPHAQLD
ncbi:MAG: endonuclease III [Anaerotardibacter sp.]